MQHFMEKHQTRHLQLIAMTQTNISYQPSDSQSTSWTVNWPLSASWQNFQCIFLRWHRSILSAVFHCHTSVLALGVLSTINSCLLFGTHRTIFLILVVITQTMHLNHAIVYVLRCCHSHTGTHAMVAWYFLKSHVATQRNAVKGRKCRNQ